MPLFGRDGHDENEYRKCMGINIVSFYTFPNLFYNCRTNSQYAVFITKIHFRIKKKKKILCCSFSWCFPFLFKKKCITLQLKKSISSEEMFTFAQHFPQKALLCIKINKKKSPIDHAIQALFDIIRAY